MAKPVTGFQTADGKFFDFAEEADLYDAMHGVRFETERIFPRIKPEVVFAILDNLDMPIRKYLDAKEKYYAAESLQPDESIEREPVENKAYRDRRTKVLEAVLPFPPNSGESVSEMGSGERSEEIQDEGEINGTGGGRSDARDVRSLQDMAAHVPPGTAGAWKPDRN